MSANALSCLAAQQAKVDIIDQGDYAGRKYGEVTWLAVIKNIGKH